MAKEPNTGAARFLPEEPDLPALRRAASACKGCDLFKNATQTVFGEGAEDARFMLVGEQPGDQEDREGQPFVGPAGRVLDRALEEAGIDRGAVYVTNAVKHFKFEPRGKRRIHRKPSMAEINACRPWLDAEVRAIGPELIVVLGATAARAVLGPAFRVTERRGEVLRPSDVDGTGPGGYDGYVVATIHPSAVLRAPDRDAAYEGFLADLRVAARVASQAHRS